MSLLIRKSIVILTGYIILHFQGLFYMILLLTVTVRKLLNSWAVSIRHMWNLPMDSIDISVRFVKFLQNVQKSDKVAVQFMLRK